MSFTQIARQNRQVALGSLNLRRRTLRPKTTTLDTEFVSTGSPWLDSIMAPKL